MSIFNWKINHQLETSITRTFVRGAGFGPNMANHDIIPDNQFAQSWASHKFDCNDAPTSSPFHDYIIPCTLA